MIADGVSNSYRVVKTTFGGLGISHPLTQGAWKVLGVCLMMFKHFASDFPTLPQHSVPVTSSSILLQAPAIANSFPVMKINPLPL